VNYNKVKFTHVLKYPEEPHKTVHVSNGSSIDNAKLFFESPEFIYLEKLEESVL